MKKWSLFLPIFIFGYTFGKEVVRSLCDNPIIYAANRLSNNTFRVYRDNHYWELKGLPNRVATPSGPFKITDQYMAPVDKDTSIMTVLSGDITGNTWKFRKNRLWQWNEKGRLEVGGIGGVEWKEIPEKGFHCVMNDGTTDKMGPKLIGLTAIKAYYWRTKRKTFEPIGNIYQGYIGGQFGEEFPEDPTACMTFPSTEPSIKYFVYLFRREKYCFRPITGEKGCAEWRLNKELFGCNKQKEADSSATTLAQNDDNGVDGDGSIGGGDGNTGDGEGSNGSGDGTIGSGDGSNDGDDGNADGVDVNTGGGDDSKPHVTSGPQLPDEPEGGENAPETTTSASFSVSSQKISLLFAFYLFLIFH